MKKTISIILLTTVVLSLFTSCGKKKNDGDLYNYTGEFTTYMYTPDSMNPLITKYKTNAQVLSMMYSPLYKINEDLSIEPVVANSHKFTDINTLDIQLNKEIKFTDGSNLTANDVIESLNVLAKHPENLYYPVFDYIKSYQKTDDYTITINLKKACSSIIPYLNFPILKGGTKGIGSGPYSAVSRDKNKFVMTASKSSPTQTKIKTINVMLYSKEKLQNSAFMNNEINVVNTDLYDLAQFSSKKNATIREYTSNYFTFLSFNNERINDINIKKAIAYSIDKKDLTSTILVGHATETVSPYRPGTIYDTTQINDYSVNKEKAIEFLGKSGLVPEDVYYTILVNNETPSKQKSAEYIASTLSAIGMNVNISLVDFETYTKRIENNEYDMFIGETLMPESYDLSFLFKESNIINQQVDENISKFIDKVNFSSYSGRPEAAAELSKYLLNSLPIISLYFRENMLVTTNDITGEFNLSPNNVYADIINWQIKQETIKNET